MNDPHVTAILYRLVVGEFVEFSPPEATLAFSLGNCDWSLRATSLRIEPKDHYASRDIARTFLEPLVQAWAVEAGARLRIPTLRFEYERTELIDRAPEPGQIALYGEATASSSFKASAVIVRQLKDYPPPPSIGFEVSPDVDTLWRRYGGYLAGREPLLSMAYFAFTVLTAGANGLLFGPP